MLLRIELFTNMRPFATTTAEMIGHNLAADIRGDRHTSCANIFFYCTQQEQPVSKIISPEDAVRHSEQSQFGGKPLLDTGRVGKQVFSKTCSPLPP